MVEHLLPATCLRDQVGRLLDVREFEATFLGRTKICSNNELVLSSIPYEFKELDRTRASQIDGIIFTEQASCSGIE